jgi:MoxR-like ATPase
VYVHELLEAYIIALVQATRDAEDLSLGASPRGSLALYRTGQAYAAIQGRNYVLPDDIQLLAPSVLVHRLIPSAQTRLRGRSVVDLFADIVAKVPVPVEESWSVQKPSQA